MAVIDVEQLVKDIENAATEVLDRDIAAVTGFSERQVKAISQHAALVAGGIATGEITEETREFFLESIEKMTQTFLDVLQGLTLLTLEKLWNAVVGVVWKAMNGAIAATGLALPIPLRS